MSLRSVTRKFNGKQEEPNEELQGSRMFLFWAVSFLTSPPNRSDNTQRKDSHHHHPRDEDDDGSDFPSCEQKKKKYKR